MKFGMKIQIYTEAYRTLIFL